MLSEKQVDVLKSVIWALADGIPDTEPLYSALSKIQMQRGEIKDTPVFEYALREGLVEGTQNNCVCTDLGRTWIDLTKREDLCASCGGMAKDEDCLICNYTI